MKIFDNLKKIINNIFKKNTIECELEDHCPIYLSYLGKYDKNSKDISHCQNANKLYCKKYRLVNTEKWGKMSTEKKLKVISDMDIIIKTDNNKTNVY